MLEYADSFELKITNTWIKKDVEKLIAFKSCGQKTVIKYILVNQKGTEGEKCENNRRPECSIPEY